MSEREAIMGIILDAMGDAWSDSEEYSALPGVTADLLLTSDWMAEHDRQVAERARVEFADELTRKGVHTFDIHSIRRAAKGEQKWASR